MNTPKYSVIVPIHNIDKQYLKKCVESILEQTLTDLELILVDDGSTDKSGALCDSYIPRDARVRVFHKKTAESPLQEMQELGKHVES